MSKKTDVKAFHDDLHDIMDGAGTMKDTEISEAFVAKGWRKQKKGENVSGTPSLYECSVCHWRDIDTYTADTSEYNYCPNCGAKMIIESKYTEDNQ